MRLRAVEFPLAFRAALIRSVVKGAALGLSLCFFRMSRIIRQVAVFEWWGVGLVNCLAKWVAILFLLEKLLFEKVIGWFGAVKTRFPQRRLRALHSLMERRLIEHDAILLRNFSPFFLSFSLCNSSFFKVISGLVWFCVLRISRWRISSRER